MAAIRNADQPSWPPPSLHRYDRMTLADLWRQNGADDGAIALLSLGYLELWDDGPASYSALSGLRDRALNLIAATGWFAIQGGNDRLAMTESQPGPRRILNSYMAGQTPEPLLLPWATMNARLQYSIRSSRSFPA